MAEVDTAIDSQFGSETPQPAGIDAADIFDQAKEHFVPSSRPVTADPEHSLPSDEGATEADDETGNEGATTEGAEKQDSQSDETEFKPYSFKGSVFKSPVEKTFESPEELNSVIARGLASETLYKRLKERENEIQGLKTRAESGDEFETFARENPRDLVEMIFDKYMDQQASASFVLEKFEELRAYSRLTPEERANKDKLKLADKLLKERELSEQAAAKAKQQQEVLKTQQEASDERNWAQLELRRAMARFDKLEQGVIRDQILGVIAQARLAKQQGASMTQKQMSAKLNQFLKPFEKLSSPSETRRKLGETLDQKKKEASTVVQNAARGQSQSRGSASKIPADADSGDIFDMIKKSVLSGKMRLRQ